MNKTDIYIGNYIRDILPVFRWALNKRVVGTLVHNQRQEVYLLVEDSEAEKGHYTAANFPLKQWTITYCGSKPLEKACLLELPLEAARNLSSIQEEAEQIRLHTWAIWFSRHGAKCSAQQADEKANKARDAYLALHDKGGLKLVPVSS